MVNAEWLLFVTLALQKQTRSPLPIYIFFPFLSNFYNIWINGLNEIGWKHEIRNKQPSSFKSALYQIILHHTCSNKHKRHVLRLCKGNHLLKITQASYAQIKLFYSTNDTCLACSTKNLKFKCLDVNCRYQDMNSVSTLTHLLCLCWSWNSFCMYS